MIRLIARQSSTETRPKRIAALASGRRQRSRETNRCRAKSDRERSQLVVDGEFVDFCLDSNCTAVTLDAYQARRIQRENGDNTRTKAIA